MNTTLGLIGLLAGIAAAAGLIVLVIGLRPTPDRPDHRLREPLSIRWARLTRRPAGRAGRRRDILWAVTGVIALGIVAATGWVLALVIVPMITLLVPWLLADTNKAALGRTAALDSWVRSLRSILLGGSDNTLEAALIASLSTTPAPIREEVAALAARLKARWNTDRALESFANDMDDPTADTIATALILASQRRGSGLSQVLDALTAAVRDEVEARRKAESAKAVPRTTALYMTVLFALVAGALIILNPGYVAPYATPLGQAILAVVIMFFLGSLWLLRRIATVSPRSRIYPVVKDRHA